LTTYKSVVRPLNCDLMSMSETNLSKGHRRDMTPSRWDEALVSSKTLREKLGLGESAFHALLRRGLPRYQLNRRLLRFRLTEVQAWLAEHRRGEFVG